ncbi:MAG: hypothetical protein NTW87_30920 [Planctomycetota bacterium]|nr:hypothetical protein [Planctomycetota bacterium]
MIANRIITVVLCLAATSATAANVQNQDEELDIIVRADKIPVPPTIISQDNYLQVIGKKAGEVKVPSYAVKEVIYANRDANYSAALEKRDEGRYRLAALYFRKALENMSAQKWAAEYCNYGIGDALYQSGDFKGYKGKSGTEYAPPSQYFQKVLAANPKSRFLPDILVKLPVCLAEEDKLDEAEAKLKEAETRIKAYRDETIKVHTGFGEIADRATAQLAIADARLAKRKAKDGKAKWDEVRDKWSAARSKCLKFPEPLAEAVDGVLEALLMMKDYNGAQAEAESVISRYKTEGDTKLLPMLPGAYTALGKAHLAQAVEFKGRGAQIPSRTKFSEARWAFLHVVGQFFDNDEYVAGAHYFAGICCDDLREVESDAGERAIRHWKLIVRNFPKSDYRAPAEKELARVGTAAPAAQPQPPAEAKAEPKAEPKPEPKPAPKAKK